MNVGFERPCPLERGARVALIRLQQVTFEYLLQVTPQQVINFVAHTVICLSLMAMPSGAVRKHVACTNCRARKLRCEFSPGVSACRRCTDGGRADECVVQEPRARPARGKRTAPAHHQEVGQSRTNDARVAQPTTTHPTNRQAKRQQQSKSKSREREVDSQTRVMPAHNDVPLGPILELEDDCDSDAVDLPQDKLDRIAEILRVLMGSNDEEADEDGSGSDEDTDTDASESSDGSTDDEDLSSEESEEDIMPFFYRQRHPPSVSQALISQQWGPGWAKGKSALAEPKPQPINPYGAHTYRMSVPRGDSMVLTKIYGI